MGKSSGSNTSTTTSSNSPPSAFTNAYTNTYNTANAVSQTPYQQYSGNLVAGLSPDQSAGITSVENSQGIADPYINSAAQYINASTTPLSQYYNPYGQSAMAQYGSANNTNQAAQNFTTQGGTALTANDIQQYESPYTQQVVNATQAEFNNQNQQQSTQLAGNAVSQGAFGGDREAVAQSTLAGQQQLSQAPTIASLYNQGYQQAVSTAEQQKQAALSAGQGLTSEASQLGQTGAGVSNVGSTYLGANEANAWLNSQAGYGMANLGSEAQSSALTGANALLSVGSTEQQQAQSLLNVPYEQYTAQQSYPFQTTSWLSGIASGLGSNSGGTSSSTNTSNSGNSLSSILGTGLTTAGLANSAFSTNSSGGNNGLSNIFSSIFGSGSSSGSSGLDTVTNLGLTGDLSGLTIARGGSVPSGRIERRASGGASGVMSAGGVDGHMSGSPNQTITLPTSNSDGVPDVSLSYVPSANTNTGGTPLILGNYGTTSQTTGGGSSGSGASSALGAIGTVASIASLFNRGGGMRPANNAHYGGWEQPKRRAAGGNTISVTMAPGSYAGSQDVPILSHGNANTSDLTGAGGTPGTNTGFYGSSGAGTAMSTPPAAAGSLGTGALSSNPTVQNYLSSQLGSASFAPATTYSSSAGTYGPAGHTSSAPSSSSTAASGTQAGDAAYLAANGATDIAYLNNSNNFGSGSGSPGAGGGARGGPVRRFADGGGGLPPSQIFPDDPTPQVGDTAGMMPDVGAGVSMGQGSGPPEPDSPEPTIAATTTEPPPSGGMGDTGGMGMQPASSGEKGSPPKKGKDWGELMTLIGANMMAGRSGNAFQNIGSGIAKGMQQYENEEAVANRLSNQANDLARKIKEGDEKAANASRRTDIYDYKAHTNAEFQADSVAVRQRMADIAQQRANTGQEAVDNRQLLGMAQQQLTQQKLAMQAEAMEAARTGKGQQFALRANSTQLNAALRWRQQNTERDPYTGKITKQPSLEDAMGAVGSVLPQQGQGQGQQGQGAPRAPLTPPSAAIDALKANPSLAPQFHEKYGVDPQQYLGTQ